LFHKVHLSTTTLTIAVYLYRPWGDYQLVKYEFQSGGLEAAKKVKSGQPSGLALIESLYFRAGPKAAEDQLQRLLGPDQAVRPFALCDSGQPSVGMDIAPADEIAYESYSPPPSWNAAYSLQRVRMGHREKSEFVFHPGEELLIPIHGEVAYHFFWSPGAQQPERVLVSPAAKEGTILRINPQIPHHAWGLRDGAEAWLVLRHSTNSPAALVMDQDSASLAVKHGGASLVSVRDQHSSSSTRAPLRRRVTASDLRKPGAYAMIAWGISELIRDTRQRTGLTTTDLARQVGIDPSSLSRLEEAKANVSIEMLGRVCRALRIGMAERMKSGSWIYDREQLDSRQSKSSDLPLTAPNGPHFLHPHIFRFRNGESRRVFSGRGQDTSQISSWIVLEGRLLLELGPKLGGKSVIAESGNVLHFREHGEVAVQALQNSNVIQIVHSQLCECAERQAGTN
jgi:transcriptional regulator with XRE-family HTH domain